MSAFQRPEWDTPPNGDFASYVERLTEAQLRPADVSPGKVVRKRSGEPAPRRPFPASAPSDSGGSTADRRPSARTRLVTAVRWIRAALWLLMAALAAAFFVAGWGSLVVLGFVGFLLWLATAAASALGAHGQRPTQASRPGKAAALESLLRTLAQAPHSSSRPPRK